MLSTTDKMYINSEIALKGKKKTVAYLLWFFLSTFGGHKFYLGENGSGTSQLILFWGGLITVVFGIGALMLAIWMIWVIVDLFTTAGKVDKINNKMQQKLINQILDNKESELNR